MPKLTQEEKRQLWNVLNHEVAHDVEEESPELLAGIDEGIRSLEIGERTSTNEKARQLDNRIKIVKRDLIPIMVLFLAAMNSPATRTAEAQSLSGAEEHFVMEAASGGVAEVKLSELAKNRASDAKVKDFANRMITDHTQANDELKPIADFNKIAWPDRLEGDSDTAYKQLSKLSGPKFDEEYIKVMVKDHDKTVRDFEDASHKVKNATIKAYIDKTLPVLRQHQQHAHELAKEGQTRKA